MKIYVLVKVDVQDFGFNAKDVVVSTEIDELNAIMRREYLEECKSRSIPEEYAFPEDGCTGTTMHQFCENAYAYVDGFAYWDIFTRDITTVLDGKAKDLAYGLVLSLGTIQDEMERHINPAEYAPTEDEVNNLYGAASELYDLLEN